MSLSKKILVFVIFSLALFVRFYDYGNRLIFGPEQAMSLITSGEMIKEKFSLLGEAYIQRETSAGHFLFHSALFSYSLIPLQLIFNYDPFSITVFFTLLNIFTALLIFLLVKKESSYTLAIFSAIIFLFNSKMIHHSLFIWTLNYLPIVGVLSLYLLWNYFKDKSKYPLVLLLGILSGIGFGLQFVYLFSAIAIYLVILFISKSKIKATFLYLIGGIVGDLPMVLFDIKHNFYHLNTLYEFFLDARAHRVASFYTYYQFLNLWPLYALMGGALLYFIFKVSKPISILLVFAYIYVNINTPHARLFNGKLTQNEINLNTLNVAAEKIANSQPPKKFNVATLLDFDSRANPLRYILTYQYGLKPQAVENYKDVDALFVLALKDYDFKNPKVWEVQVFQPYKISDLNFGYPNHLLYKLSK